jgi:hypothetical protein
MECYQNQEKLGIQNSPKDWESIVEYLEENVTKEIERTKKGTVILIFKKPTVFDLNQNLKFPFIII